MNPIKDYSQIDYSQPYEGNMIRHKLNSYGVLMKTLSVISKIIAVIFILIGALLLLISIVGLLIGGVYIENMWIVTGVILIVIACLLLFSSKKCENKASSSKATNTQTYKGYDFDRYKCLNYEREMCKDCRWNHSRKCSGGYWSTDV